MDANQMKLNKACLTELTLSQLPINKKAEIIHILGPEPLTRRLTGLGLIPGTVISAISHAPFNGPIQIEVRNTRLAIGRGIADNIQINLC